MRRHLVFIAVLLAMVTASTDEAAAVLPPFELVRQSLADERAKQKLEGQLTVTVTGDAITEYAATGTLAADGSLELQRRGGGPKVTMSAEAPLPFRFLWIALVASDPVAQIGRFGTIDAARSVVEVRDDAFVYVYGSMPKVAVSRDMKSLSGFEVRAEGHAWKVRIREDASGRRTVLITRDGLPLLNARFQGG